MPLSLNINTRSIIGKVKTRSQLCRVYTDDGRIVIVEPSVLKACICDDSKMSGWVIDQDNLVQDEDTGLWVQLLDERSMIPVPAVIGKIQTKDLGAIVDQIFKDSVAIDFLTMNDKQKRDRQRTWWFVILGTPIILAALILGIKVING
jgi:hypothetical protein